MAINSETLPPPSCGPVDCSSRCAICEPLPNVEYLREVEIWRNRYLILRHRSHPSQLLYLCLFEVRRYLARSVDF